MQTFLDKGRIYPEIASVERRIDMHIELLRRDEFREMECASDIDKYGHLLSVRWKITNAP